ncbi:hypothetical protein Q9Q94_00505 [Uliginosibacterium sp. 31-16]|uniref:hypothetical protein n=1 Tax=Uliginosibacterium sp. 31-16 TaxID=3068315 RepID=UPI00273F5B17|nr:hypothetical protein [Uliginosibacterium sp. 31-16]MDP5237987.1 hypothetical protein [Uliginosibacterium sp. 31-16]
MTNRSRQDAGSGRFFYTLVRHAMRLFRKASKEVQASLEALFPDLEAVLEVKPNGMGKAAISVFDHWLRDESEWHLMDCFEGPERINRDRKFLNHWAAIFDATPVFTIRSRGRWPHKSKRVFKEYLDRDGFLRQCRFDPKKAPTQVVLLPEFDCIIVASWDDTNVVFYNHLEKAEPIIRLAKGVGLHCLEYDA